MKENRREGKRKGGEGRGWGEERLREKKRKEHKVL